MALSGSSTTRAPTQASRCSSGVRLVISSPFDQQRYRSLAWPTPFRLSNPSTALQSFYSLVVRQTAPGSSRLDVPHQTIVRVKALMWVEGGRAAVAGRFGEFSPSSLPISVEHKVAQSRLGNPKTLKPPRPSQFPPPTESTPH